MKGPVKTGGADLLDHLGRFARSVEGKDLDTNVTVLFVVSENVGDGTGLHVLTYNEVFIVRSGHARFFIGDDMLEAQAGDILMGPDVGCTH